MAVDEMYASAVREIEELKTEILRVQDECWELRRENQRLLRLASGLSEAIVSFIAEPTDAKEATDG